MNSESRHMETSNIMDVEAKRAIKGNFYNKIVETCARQKITPSKPLFDVSISDGLFRCEASLGCLGRVWAEASRKQVAKNVAAMRLYQLLCRKLGITDESRGGESSGDSGGTSRSDSSQSGNNGNSLYELTLPSRPKITIDEYEFPVEEPSEIKLLLEYILSSRKERTGSEKILMTLMELPHPQIVRVFEDPIIAFNGTCSDGTDGGNVQVYLEITCKCPSPAEASPASAGGGRREKTIAAAAVDEYQQKSSAPKKFVNVFGGQGETEQLARDDACASALQYLYYFGGFDAEVISVDENVAQN